MSEQHRYTDIELARWIAARLEDGAEMPVIDVTPARDDNGASQARWIAAMLEEGDATRPPSLGTVPQGKDRGGRPDKGPWNSWIDRWALRVSKEGLCESKEEAGRWLKEIEEADGYKVSKTAAQNHLRGTIPHI
jgi:hypothetical protein